MAGSEGIGRGCSSCRKAVGPDYEVQPSPFRLAEADFLGPSLGVIAPTPVVRTAPGPTAWAWACPGSLFVGLRDPAVAFWPGSSSVPWGGATRLSLAPWGSEVRLCSDQLSLIKECLLQLPSNYKQSSKLLELADLLRVAGDDRTERKGKVLILLVQQALQLQDYKAANMHCQELMASGYSESWEVCSQLGQSEGYRDMAVRQDLIAYALTHCPPSAIKSLLAASNTLRTEILYHAVSYQMHPSEKGESIHTSKQPLASKIESPVGVDTSIPSRQSADLLQWTTAKTMKVISDTTLTTKAMLHAVSDRQWWKKSLTYLRPLHGQEFGDVLKTTNGTNAAIEKQGCHTFYESLIDEPYLANNEVTYTTYQHNPSESFAEVLLRTGKLAETKSEGHDQFPSTEDNINT
uniref:Uncharacterized protein n=1 Tax=Sphaerodactylus townsendi TaxID=933632 RepID=A0ACB8GE38_9SAUR